MKKWLELWPLLGLPIVWIVPVDITVIPYVLARFSFWPTVFIIWSISVPELVYIYWLIGKMELLVKRAAVEKLREDAVQQDVEFAKKVVGRLKGQGYFKIIRNYALDKYGGTIKNFQELLFPLMRKGGYALIFIIGVIPEVGFRIAGATFCQLINWRTGFIVLVAGSLVNKLLMVKFWSALSHMPFGLRIAIVLGTLFLVWLFIKIVLRIKRAQK